MSGQSDGNRPPDELFRVRLPITISVILGLMVTLLTVAYGMLLEWRPIITFFGAAVGVAAGVLTAIHRGRTLRITIEQRTLALAQQKVSLSLRFAERWNSPEFASLKRRWRRLLEELEKSDPDAVYSKLHSDHECRTLTTDILNFFEEMSYAARIEAADPDTLKKIFRSVLVRYYTAARPWVDRHRGERAQQSGYEHLEWLNNQWKTG